jgi:hypothetical protein
LSTVLAFPVAPDVGIVAKAMAHGPEAIDTPDMHGVAPYATQGGLPDVSWRRIPGPETLAPSTNWFRGDRGSLACAVETEDSVRLLIFDRDGGAVAHRLMEAAWAQAPSR